MIKYAYLFLNAGIFKRKEKLEIINAIKGLNESKTREILCGKMDAFKKKLIEKVNEEDAGVDYVLDEIEASLKAMYKQISLFEDVE